MSVPAAPIGPPSHRAPGNAPGGIAIGRLHFVFVGTNAGRAAMAIPAAVIHRHAGYNISRTPDRTGITDDSIAGITTSDIFAIHGEGEVERVVVGVQVVLGVFHQHAVLIVGWNRQSVVE